MDFQVLECRRFIAADTASTQRVVHNYEFDFYLTGPRTMILDGRKSLITDNSLCVRRPGQFITSKGDYNCYILTLDFSMQTPYAHYLRHTPNRIEPCRPNMLVDALPDVFTPYHHAEIQALFAELSGLPSLRSPLAHSLTEQILFLANADILRARRDAHRLAQTPADEILHYINRAYCSPITLNSLAQLVHLDKSYLVRLFKKQFGISPIDYIIQLRIQHAADLLADTDMPVHLIAAECGYSSSSFFISQFKKSQGMTPLTYRLCRINEPIAQNQSAAQDADKVRL